MTTSPKSRQNCPRPPNFPFAAPGPIGPSPNPVGRPPAKSVPKARATRAGSQSAPLLGSAVGRPPVSIGQTAMVHPEDCGYRRGRCIPKVYHWSSAPPIRCWRIATSRALAIIRQRTVPVGVKKPSFPRDGRCCTVAAVQRGRDTLPVSGSGEKPQISRPGLLPFDCRTASPLALWMAGVSGYRSDAGMPGRPAYLGS
jgi:hypothetical protein